MNETIVDADFKPLAVPARETAAPALFGTTDPVESIGKMVAVADALKGILVGKKLVSTIQGREYVMVEGWQVLAGMLRVSAVIEWTRPVDGGGWESRCVVYDPMGNTIGAGEGQCTRDERTWAKREDFALRAMSQTRATSRALRNVLGFIVTLAGYSATPAEEMTFSAPPLATPKPEAPVPTSELVRLAKQAGVELRPWLLTHVAADLDQRPRFVLTGPESIKARDLLLALIEDEPIPPEPAVEAKKPTPKQRAMLFALHSQHGHDDAARHDLYAAYCGGAKSYSDLTAADLARLIDVLTLEPAHA